MPAKGVLRSALLTLLVGAAVAAPASALGPQPAPPVIREPFVPAPCPIHPDTAIDVQGCQEMRIWRTDRQIDREVAAIFRLLRSQSARISFAAEERGWLHYRRRSCSAEASRSARGGAEAVAYLNCTLRRNRSHLADLGAKRRALH